MSLKARGILMMVAAALFASLMVLPASADTLGVGAFRGSAEVGKWFATPCDKNGTGDPTGRGLYLPGTVTLPGISNGDDTREEEGTWRLSIPETDGVAVGTQSGTPFAGAFELNVCGWLSATVDPDRRQRDTPGAIGASCGTSKGHHGQGNVLFTNGQRIKLFNVGWKASVGGTLPVVGNYQEYINDQGDPNSPGNKGKVGQVLAQVQAQGGDDCLGLKLPTTNNGNGAQLFNVAGVAEFLQPQVTPKKEDDDPTEPIFGPKQCKGTGPESPIVGGKKQHEPFKPNSSDCSGGRK